VMTSEGRFIEVQGTAEGQASFTRSELDGLLGLAEKGIAEIVELQRVAVADPPRPRPSSSAA
jgi:ribonuclease PH